MMNMKAIFLVCLLFSVALLVSGRELTEAETQTTLNTKAEGSSVGGYSATEKKEGGVKPDFLGFHRHHHHHGGGGRYPPATANNGN